MSITLIFPEYPDMPAKGTTTGNKQNWLRAIAIALNVLGRDASNDSLEYWLRSEDGRKYWLTFTKDFPTPGTLRNYFTDARKTGTGADRPWSMGQTVDGKPGEVIPSDTLPTVLLVWLRSTVGGRTLTVRQARWCSRLAHIFSVAAQQQTFLDDGWVEMLYAMSSAYAAREQLAEQKQELGAETGDLDGVLAFAMATLSGDAASSGANPGIDLATGLGFVKKLGEVGGESARIDKENLRLLRDSVVKAMDSKTDKSTETQKPKPMPYWASVYLSLGLRALASSEDWESLEVAGREERALELGKAIDNLDWDEFQRLTKQAETEDAEEQGKQS